MSEKSAGAILASTIEKIRDLVDTSTIIGEPIYAEGNVTIIPISKVTYGFASGGADFTSKNSQELFGGGGGAGVTITPIAFLVIMPNDVKLLQLSVNASTPNALINMVPDVMDKVTGFLAGRQAKNEGRTEVVEKAD